MGDKYKYSSAMDASVDIIEDIMPERMIKVYPYELINTKESVGLLSQQSVSIAAISQKNMTDEQGMKKDAGGNWYFEAIPGFDLSTRLEQLATTSTLTKILEEEATFSLISNSYFKSIKKKIMVGQTSFNPTVFTINEPINIKKVNEGINKEMQEVYLGSSTKIGKEYIEDESILNGSGIYEINLININALTSQYANSLIKFTLDEYINIDTKNSKNENGITIVMDNKTLLNTIKIKGKINKNDENVSDIDLISDSLMPIKATPIGVKDKLSMYMDWFDYDTVMPLGYAEKFRTGNTINSVITNKDDLNMINDMLLMSYLFASNFGDVDVVTQNNVDKLDPKTVIGSQAISVTKIIGKDPIKVVDGIYEKHIRNHPSFLTDRIRFQTAQSIINGLCRYIYSSHTIGKGNNAFGWAYLPWYLEPKTKIDIKKTKNKEFKEIKLIENLKLTSKSIFFSEKYTMQNVNRSEEIDSKKLVLPKKINISNEILVQTDRKLTLPEVPYKIQPLNKLPLPGDINTKSSADLAYMWWIPMDDKKYKKMMLNNLSDKTVIPVGTEFKGNLPNSPIPEVWNNKKVLSEISKIYKGKATLKSAPPTITKEWGQPTRGKIVKKMSGVDPEPIVSFKYWDGRVLESQQPGPADPFHHHGDWTPVDQDNLFLPFFQHIKKDEFRFTSFSLEMRYTHQNDQGAWELRGGFTVEFPYTSFGPFTMITTSSYVNETFGYDERKLLFDKYDWNGFLYKYGFINKDTFDLDLKTMFGEKISVLNEIILTQVFGEKIKIKIGNSEIKVPLFNKNDETVSTQKIIFT